MLKRAGGRLLATPFHVRARRVEKIYTRGIEAGEEMENRSGEERLVQLGRFHFQRKEKGQLDDFHQAYE